MQKEVAISSKRSPLTIHRYGTNLYGGHARLHDKVIFFVRRQTGDLIPGGLCKCPDNARSVSSKELHPSDLDTILQTITMAL